MEIHVKYFAVVRERTGISQEILELPDGADINAAFDAVCARHPEVAPIKQWLRCAVNRSFCTFDMALTHRDELVFIPPVSGGSDAIVLTTEPLDYQAIRACVASHEHGAIVVFEGVVRNHRDGTTVTTLEYETYEDMARDKLREICARAQDTYGVVAAIHHRHGLMHVSQTAVLIAVGAAHRAEAFDACRQIIEDLKAEVPIWKRETGPDGSVWVGIGP